MRSRSNSCTGNVNLSNGTVNDEGVVYVSSPIPTGRGTAGCDERISGVPTAQVIVHSGAHGFSTEVPSRTFGQRTTDLEIAQNSPDHDPSSIVEEQANPHGAHGPEEANRVNGWEGVGPVNRENDESARPIGTELQSLSNARKKDDTGGARHSCCWPTAPETENRES